MRNRQQLLEPQNDPWAPHNFEKSNIEYPTLDSVIDYQPNPYFNQQNLEKKQVVTYDPIYNNQATNNNDRNVNNSWTLHAEYRGEINQQNPKDKLEERQRPKIFENGGGQNNNNYNINLLPPPNNYNNNNNGWDEPTEKKPINLFGVFKEKQVEPVNLWSSKFASVLKRNIQLSMFQIKKKINYEEKEGQNWVQDQKKKHQSKFFNTAMKLEDFLNEQVVLLEASPHQMKLKQLQKRGQVFRDEDFPPTSQSLFGDWDTKKQWRQITWKKISSLIKNPVIFDKKIVPQSIKQGILGDCYLLAALAALAESPQRIFNLFLTTEQNAQKYYAVKILYKGMWKTIDMDEYIPVLNNKPAFSKALGPELWVVLFQKAWAKLYGSYKNIEAGYPEEGLHDLTGAHVEMLRLQRKGFQPQEAWKYLMKATKRKYSMISSSQPGSDTKQLESGVVLGHAYTIMGVYEIQINGKLQRLIKLRNPWGRTQTKGPWSDRDPIWKSLPRQQRQRLGYLQNEHDGVCFQAYRDFLRDFRTVTVAEVSDTASYVYHTQQTAQYKGCYFKVRVFKEGQYSLQINQTPDRMFPRNVQKNFKYLPATLLIGKVTEGNNVRYYSGVQEPYRTIYKKHVLTPGEYVVFGKIYYNKYETDYSVTLAVYGENACLVQPCPANFCPYFKEKLYMNRAKNSKYKELKSGVFYNQEIMTEGYIYCAMWNKSSKSAKFLIKIQPNQNPSVRVKRPFNGQKQLKIVLEPGKQQIILARVPDFTSPTGGIGSVQFGG